MSAPAKIKASDHESYFTNTVIAIVIPFVGFILGIVFLTKDKPVDRKLGEHLLAISIAFSAVQGLLFYFAYYIQYMNAVNELGRY